MVDDGTAPETDKKWIRCKKDHPEIMFEGRPCPICTARKVHTRRGEEFRDPAFCTNKHRTVKFDHDMGGCPVCVESGRPFDEPEDVKQLRREVHALRSWLNQHGFEGGTLGMLGFSPCDAAIGRLAAFKAKADTTMERETTADRRVERAETARRQTEGKIAVLKERLKWVVGMLGLVEEQRKVLEHRVTRSWWERWFHRPYIYLLSFGLGHRGELNLGDETIYRVLLNWYRKEIEIQLTVSSVKEMKDSMSRFGKAVGKAFAQKDQRCPGHDQSQLDYVPDIESGVLVPESAWMFHADPKDCPDCQEEDDGKAGKADSA